MRNEFGGLKCGKLIEHWINVGIIILKQSWWSAVWCSRMLQTSSEIWRQLPRTSITKDKAIISLSSIRSKPHTWWRYLSILASFGWDYQRIEAAAKFGSERLKHKCLNTNERIPNLH